MDNGPPEDSRIGGYPDTTRNPEAGVFVRRPVRLSGLGFRTLVGTLRVVVSQDTIRLLGHPGKFSGRGCPDTSRYPWVSGLTKRYKTRKTPARALGSGCPDVIRNYVVDGLVRR